MTANVDLTDVPTIEERDLALALRMMLAEGRYLAGAQDFSEEDIRRVEQAFWSRRAGTHSDKVAVLLRLRSLIAVFCTRRLKELLSQYGANAVPYALQIAAKMRLNTKWGFNPQKFAWALHEALAAQTALASAA
jgi:hypothetical protein